MFLEAIKIVVEGAESCLIVYRFEYLPGGEGSLHFC